MNIAISQMRKQRLDRVKCFVHSHWLVRRRVEIQIQVCLTPEALNLNSPLTCPSPSGKPSVPVLGALERVGHSILTHEEGTEVLTHR